MINMDYRQDNSDHTQFIKQDGEKSSILLVYVDDMVITGNDGKQITKLKRRLSEEFDIKDLGKLRYFFGVKFARSKGSLVMSHIKYIIDLLKEIRKHTNVYSNRSQSQTKSQRWREAG